MKSRIAGLTLVLVGLVSTTALAQGMSQDAAPLAVKTKSEAFAARDGVVIIKGIGDSTVVHGQYGSGVSIEPREFLDASVGKRQYGVAVTVKETGRFERESISYVDLEEVDSLLKGLDYIFKVDKSATKLDGYEATYKTRGDLVLTVFSSGEKVSGAISSGVIGRCNAFLDLAAMAKVRDAIAQAKTRLDSIRQ